jgi:general secretion pathway protein H
MNIINNKGFTLIELLTVILIISIVITVVAPMYKGGQKSDLKVVARKLVSDLRYARSVAISQGTRNTVVFEFKKNIYFLTNKKELNTIPDEVDVTLMLDLAEVTKKNGKIHFYPDGSSSGGIVKLKKNGVVLKVTTSWLLGTVELKV